MATTSDFATRASALRETAKWIAAAFTGAGAVLFSGLSFTNTSKPALIEDWQLAIFLAALPFIAAAWAVRQASRVITANAPGMETLLPLFAAGLGLPNDKVDDKVRLRVGQLLPTITTRFGGIESLDGRLAKAHDELRVAEGKWEAAKTPALKATYESASSDFRELQTAANEVLAAAEYVVVERRYSRARWQFVISGGLAVVAVGASGMVFARGQDQAVLIQRATPAVIHFADGAAEKRVGNPGCPVRNGMDALAIGGTYTRPLLLMKGVKPEAGKPGYVPAQNTCAEPWVWQPEWQEIVIEPKLSDQASGG